MQKPHSHSAPLMHRLALMAFRAADIGKVPPEIVLRAKQSLADWFACALAGSMHEHSLRVRAYGESCAGTGPCTVLGTRRRLPVAAAALLNGFSGHVLDWDDVNIDSNVHASAAVLPAIWALAEARNASGADLLKAYLVGTDVMCLLGRLGGDAHYRAGWHASSVLGVFGAGVGCAALLRSNVRVANAMLGFALAQSCGVQAVFGTAAKPFQVARAAEAGVHAALLAESGLRGHTDVLDRPRSLAALYNFEKSGDELNQAHLKFSIRRSLIKYHASCFVTQAPLEALRELQARGVTAENLDSLEVSVAPNAAQVCSIDVPRTAGEIKFSVPHLCAMRLAGVDTGTVEAYTDATAANQDLQKLARKVKVVPREGLRTAETRMSATLADGTELAFHLDLGIPEADLNQQGRRVEAKFAALASPVIGEAGARALFEVLMQIEQAADLTAIQSLL